MDQKNPSTPPHVLERIRLWQLAHPDRVKEYKRKNWRSERARQKKAAWRKANAEKMRLFRKKWLDAHPGFRREWCTKNLTKINAYANNCRAKYVGMYTKSDVETLLQRQLDRCANPTCKKELGGVYHIDHIMPVNKGGTNWPENLQILCPRCNALKSDKDPYEWAQENGRLFA